MPLARAARPCRAPVPALAQVGADQETTGPGFVDIVFMRSQWWEAATAGDGVVAAVSRISEGVGGLSIGGALGPVGVGNKFGSALAPLNDLDGDGVPEVREAVQSCTVRTGTSQALHASVPRTLASSTFSAHPDGPFITVS